MILLEVSFLIKKLLISIDILNYIYNDEALKQCPYEKNSNDTMAFSPKVLIVSDVEKAISDFRKTYEDALLLYVSNRARFYDIGAGNLYDAYNKMEKYQFWKKYSAVDVMTKDEATNYLNDPRVSTQHGVKGESHDTVVFVADNSSNPAVHMSKFFEVWSEMNITLREFDAFYYRYSNMIRDIECTMGIKISELKAKSYAAVADMIDTVLKRFISENENNPYYIFLLKPKMEKYKKKKNVTSAKACLNEGTVYGPLCAYRLFYVGCSRARKNLLIIINREDVKNFEDKLYEKLKDCGFEVEY